MGNDIISGLEGQIFFEQREQGVLNLYTADAGLTNIELVYSHMGKGEPNEHIIEYYYDKSQDELRFIAMKDGMWGLYSIKTGEKTPHFIRNQESLLDDNAYIKPEINGTKAFNKRGSMYLARNGKETELRHYYGIYDSKFSPGYVPLGFSPDGKYLLYSWTGHFTPVGWLLESMVRENCYGVYIMDLDSKKSNYYISGQRIQWVRK